jgi:crotonobetaine/carnitine-CoA ligase
MKAMLSPIRAQSAPGDAFRMNDARAALRPPWFRPDMPARDDCVLRGLLDRGAQRHPQRRIALFEDGSAWTWAECRDKVRVMAAGLQRLGVRRGDRVAAWLPGGPRMVLSWFAVNYLGAIWVPLNTAYRGRILEHVLNQASARVLIGHGDLLERLASLELQQLESIVAIGAHRLEAAGAQIHSESVLHGDASTLDDSVHPEPWDPQMIVYTSGTTGPSKGVLSPYLQLYTTSVVNYGYLEEGESMLVNLPLFHIGGTSALYCTLVRGGMFYIVNGFSTEHFWDQVRRGNCAATSGLIGVMAGFLSKAPPRPDDRVNPLRYMTMFPINAATVAFSERFGFSYVTGFNMTECSTPLICDVNTKVYGSCGLPRTGVTCRIVDEHDLEVPRGAVGELIVRTDLPWTMLLGYDGMPEATARAWRNGWFHTGDAFRQDENGNYFFVDRIKDAIRRRGENISSVEVEAEVKAHPAVEEAVAVAVPAEGSEDEVLVAVVLRAGQSPDPIGLIEFLRPRMPYYMVPRYLRFVADIPKTETNKLRKAVIRDAGITADTWDREAAGIRLRREALRD